jgi:hypothetical protein
LSNFCRLVSRRQKAILVTVADGHWFGVHSAKERTLLRHKLDMAAIRAFQNDISAAIGHKRKFGKDVGFEFSVATETLHATHAGSGFFRHWRNASPANFFRRRLFDTHLSTHPIESPI